MRTGCTPRRAVFQRLGRRRVEARFDGDPLTSDAGLLLVREVAHRLGVFDELVSCFTDHRDRGRVKHSVRDLLTQRILALIAGYEDHNDHRRASTARAPPQPPQSLPGRSSDIGPCVNHPHGWVRDGDRSGRPGRQHQAGALHPGVPGRPRGAVQPGAGGDRWGCPSVRCCRRRRTSGTDGRLGSRWSWGRSRGQVSVRTPFSAAGS